MTFWHQHKFNSIWFMRGCSSVVQKNATATFCNVEIWNETKKRFNWIFQLSEKSDQFINVYLFFTLVAVQLHTYLRICKNQWNHIKMNGTIQIFQSKLIKAYIIRMRLTPFVLFFVQINCYAANWIDFKSKPVTVNRHHKSVCHSFIKCWSFYQRTLNKVQKTFTHHKWHFSQSKKVVSYTHWQL